MSRFTVRACRPADHQGLAAVLASLLGHDLSGALASALNTNLMRLLSQPGSTLLVAENEKGELLGFVSIWSRWGLFEDAPVAQIDTLMVRPDWQRSSVPHALLEQALGAAQSMGCSELEFIPGEGSMIPEEALAGFGFVKAESRFALSIL